MREEMTRITKPQSLPSCKRGSTGPTLSRLSTKSEVVREMLPRERFGPWELMRWLPDTQQRNERASRSHAKRRSALRAPRTVPP